MRRNTFKQIEIILSDYPDYDRYIKQREMEIMTPYAVSDENIGGGKSNLTSSPDEKKAIKLADDRVLNKLREQRDAVDKVMQNVDLKTYQIISLYYFARPRRMTWEGIAQELSYSKRQCQNIRTAVFEKLADELGLMK